MTIIICCVKSRKEDTPEESSEKSGKQLRQSNEVIYEGPKEYAKEI